MDTKARADKSGNLQLPLLQRIEHVDSHSPFSAPKDFFTASSPAGFTSVPSLVFCLYAFRKGILDNSRIVGYYDGMLGLKSKLLFLVTVLSFIFFIIPWCTRFLLFYNYSRKSRDSLVGACVMFFPSSSICRFNDPLSELPPSDWGFFVLCALATYYFQICTSVILGSGVYKAFSHPTQLILSVLWLFSFFVTLWQWRRLKVAENFLEHLAPQTSKREGMAFLSIETYTYQALLALASILQMWYTIGCSVRISQTSSATILAGDLNITVL